MQYLSIKSRKHRGKVAPPLGIAEARVVRKARKFGPALDEQRIHTRRAVLVCGAHAAGKTRWLTRLHADAGRIWSTVNAAPLFLSASRPLAAWTTSPALERWWADRGQGDADQRHWTRLKGFEQADLLPVYIAETGAILFVDDLDLLSGRKLKIAQSCLQAARVWVGSASDEGRISPGLRSDVLRVDPQVFRLSTETAYDATALMMWFMAAVCAVGGYWELAATIGGLRVLASGRRAAKQG